MHLTLTRERRGVENKKQQMIFSNCLCSLKLLLVLAKEIKFIHLMCFCSYGIYKLPPFTSKRCLLLACRCRKIRVAGVVDVNSACF